jgi:hypothetical protein
MFSIEMACVWAIAVTWDTPHRVWLIGALFGVFVGEAASGSETIAQLRQSESPIRRRWWRLSDSRWSSPSMFSIGEKHFEPTRRHRSRKVWIESQS